MQEWIMQPWPWYITGPFAGLMVPLLLLAGNRSFGVSVDYRHLCAAIFPGNIAFLKYDWKRTGLWNLTFALGIILGGFIASTFMIPGDPVIAISEATRADLLALGITDYTGFLPSDVMSWRSLSTLPGFISIIGGGFFLGFGSRYAGGCTSGHMITGLADFQMPSLVASIGFMIGGLFATHIIYPVLF